MKWLKKATKRRTKKRIIVLLCIVLISVLYYGLFGNVTLSFTYLGGSNPDTLLYEVHINGESCIQDEIYQRPFAIYKQFSFHSGVGNNRVLVKGSDGTVFIDTIMDIYMNKSFNCIFSTDASCLNSDRVKLYIYETNAPVLPVWF